MLLRTEFVYKTEKVVVGRRFLNSVSILLKREKQKGLLNKKWSLSENKSEKKSDYEHESKNKNESKDGSR